MKDILFLGDAKEELKNIPDNSVDLIATDPPYQLSPTGKGVTYQFKYTGSGKFYKGREEIRQGFMGKEWDVLPSVEIWKECLRVLKPGAFAFIMTTPRQDSLCQILMDLSQAGFQMGFSSIYWTYASGFPKSSNIAKLIDKKECKKQLTEKLGRKPTKEEFKEAWESFRKKIGIAPTSRPNTDVDNQILNWGGHGHGKIQYLTKVTSLQAKALDGSYGGFQPKPATEIILVCMKSLSEKTYVDQALKNRKGITWLDDGRIPYESDYDKKHQDDIQKGQINAEKGKFFGGKGRSLSSGNLQGRFCANLLVSDDVLDDGKKRKGEQKEISNKGSIWGTGNDKTEVREYGDSGSYSRYFSLDAWWKDRISKLPREIQRTFPFILCPKASKSEKNKGLEELPGRRFKGVKNRAHGTGEDYLSGGKWRKSPIVKNYHPTCKPIQLFSYLITIGSREGDIVLDPFIGSGTTACACVMLNRHYIGIEQSKEYYEIAKARIKAWELPLFRKEE